MNKANKKMIDVLLEWENSICNDDCKNCILNQDVECTNEFTTDYCVMLSHLANELKKVMNKEG